MSANPVEAAKVVAEVQARYVRQLMGADRVAYLNLIDALDLSREIGQLLDYPLVEDHWLPDADAKWEADRRIIVIRRDVFEDLRDGDRRSRFTIAHELGHCWLNHKFGRNRALLGKVEFGRQRRMDELAANHFAAHFLLPNHLIPKDGTTYINLCSLFGVSETVARIRANDMRDVPSSPSTQNTSRRAI